MCVSVRGCVCVGGWSGGIDDANAELVFEKFFYPTLK